VQPPGLSVIFVVDSAEAQLAPTVCLSQAQILEKGQRQTSLPLALWSAQIDG
jgi:hypothetical protein